MKRILSVLCAAGVAILLFQACAKQMQTSTDPPPLEWKTQTRLPGNTNQSHEEIKKDLTYLLNTYKDVTHSIDFEYVGSDQKKHCTNIGSGEPCPTSEDPNAVHVTQRVDFAQLGDEEDFITALRLIKPVVCERPHEILTGATDSERETRLRRQLRLDGHGNYDVQLHFFHHQNQKQECRKLTPETIGEADSCEAVVDAVHVTQRVDFVHETRRREFRKALGLEPGACE